MPKPNPEEIYHKASSGRLQNTNNPEESYDEIHFISMHEVGSEQEEREKERWRQNESVKLDDKIIGRIVFCIVGIASLAFAFILYGDRMPLIGYVLGGVSILLVAILVDYVVRKYIISRESRKYKKLKKNKK